MKHMSNMQKHDSQMAADSQRPDSCPRIASHFTGLHINFSQCFVLAGPVGRVWGGKNRPNCTTISKWSASDEKCCESWELHLKWFLICAIWFLCSEYRRIFAILVILLFHFTWFWFAVFVLWMLFGLYFSVSWFVEIRSYLHTTH